MLYFQQCRLKTHLLFIKHLLSKIKYFFFLFEFFAEFVLRCILRPELCPGSPERSRDAAADDAAAAADATAAAAAEEEEEEADESDLYQTEGGKHVFHCFLPAGLRRSLVL